MKTLKWIAILFSLLIFLIGCQSAASSEEGMLDSTPEATPEFSPDTSLASMVDFTLPDSNGNMVHLADELQNNESVVLLFYLEHAWGICMNQLGQLDKDLDKYEEKGAQVIAIAVQDETQAAQSVEKSGARFPVLADADHAVTEAYNIYNLFGGEFAAPSVFIINSDGQIVWYYIGTKLDRKPSAEILEQIP
jgi:peroxiredoxin